MRLSVIINVHVGGSQMERVESLLSAKVSLECCNLAHERALRIRDRNSV